MVKIIEHSLLTSALLEEIIQIKSVAWNYSWESHLDWLKNNLNEDDLHFLVYDNSEIIAYLNLVNVTLLVEGKPIPLMGIGNVCTKYPGKGHGKLLMTHLNNYLLKNDLQGLLFCRTNLVPFYENLEWSLYNNFHPNKDIKTLTFNKKKEGKSFYNDRLF